MVLSILLQFSCQERQIIFTEFISIPLTNMIEDNHLISDKDI